MNNGAAQSSTTTTLTRSDVQWIPGNGRACVCGIHGCLICEVEALAAPVEDGDGDAADAAELEAEVEACRFDDDPRPYAGNDDDGGFCGGDDW